MTLIVRMEKNLLISRLLTLSTELQKLRTICINRCFVAIKVQTDTLINANKTELGRVSNLINFIQINTNLAFFTRK